jgi:L-cysteine:1D-myo-inositol 2-amino-2-deoxy-alpha-D-glucopyranoside ligase
VPLLPPPAAFNSLTRRVEPVPADAQIGLYVCGITPYDAMHLGHAFTYTFFDLLVRYLRFLGHEVKYVQNVTDIDDDILRKAGEVGRDWRELGDSEVAKFHEVSRRLNNLPPDVNPRATEHIDGMCLINERLQQQGLAYESGGSLYFEVAKAQGFGRLARVPYEEQLRVANQNGNRPDDPRKRDPLDFVLWQGWQEGEPWWDSPWGRGRPGWHIECSAMGMTHLGETFTLHGGGRDLLFPHHDCEIAQSESYTGRPFVKHWLHTGMVRLDGEKMSKSLGNMVFAGDLLERYPADAVRLYLLGRDYRADWDFDEQALERRAVEAQALAKHLAGVEAATPAEAVDVPGGGVLAALQSGLNLETAVARLGAAASSGTASDAPALKALAVEVFGLTLEA